MPERSLAQWLHKLQSLHPTEIDLGLSRVRRVAAGLDLLAPGVPVITVAGTNGKGSVVAVAEALCLAAGRRPGVCTSPHLLRFNERIRVAGREAADDEIVAAFGMVDAARGDISLTYFEFATLAALLVFRQREADCLVLEVGLGGRLDAVNIIDADVAIITSIDLDHQRWLGPDRDSIAREKAGITRRGRPCVLADPDPPRALLTYLAEESVPVYRLGDAFNIRADASGCHFTLSRPDRRTLQLDAEPPAALLPANVGAALQGLLILDLLPPAENVRDALSRIVVPGRRQALEYAGHHYLLDVAHNPAAVSKLCEYLAANPVAGRDLALFAAMSDKDIHGMIRACKGAFDGWFLAELPGNPRAAPAEQVKAQLVEDTRVPVSVESDPWRACRKASSGMREGDRLVIFGSFFTVAGVLQGLEAST
jgi:dihydrofolate synthase/folylpolyglutamate synthase